MLQFLEYFKYNFKIHFIIKLSRNFKLNSINYELLYIVDVLISIIFLIKVNKDKKVSSILTGVSGEYFAAAELSRRGHIASITLRNTKGIDIVASSEDGSKTINIQVKTRSKNTKGWMLNKKS